ncbi:MAG TPA: long-chain fatty acid--CoA ligase [Actinomycetota bacterium]|nr:long-chain fatty acid--CoA ligase [Actinomycetota bacterium]
MTRDIAAERAQLEAKYRGKTIPVVLEEVANQFPDIKALNWKQGGEWVSLTYPEMRDEIRKVACGFLAQGLQPGEFVVMLARNIHQHYLADHGAVHARAVGVSLYNTLAPEQIAYIVNHCEATFAVVENRDFLERFLKIKEDVPRLRKVILIEGADKFAGDDWIIGWDEFVASGEAFDKQNPEAFEESYKAVKPDDLLTLIYTSGTTGPPKGVIINHSNALFVSYSFDALAEREPGDKVVSYLPLAHIAERATSLYIATALAGSIWCCPDLNDLATTLVEVKPQVFFGVPRVFEKIYAGIQAKVAAEPDETRKAFIAQALDVGRQVVMHEQKGVALPEELAQQHQMIDQMVFSQVRAAIGMDEHRYVVSGAAPISNEVLEFFHSIGIKILEVYGQSEDTGPTSINRPSLNKIGSVGPTLPGVEVKLADDGELLVRGPNVSVGYYKDPDLTAETFDSDGWLHSGDICEIDEDGYLRVVDRKKEIIITAGGKNIAPSNLEGALKEHVLVGQAAVIGDRRPFVSALVVLDPEVAPVWAEKNDLSAKTVAELATEPRVVEEIQAWVDKINDRFSNVEKIKKITILPAEWTAESEELTPTLKLKRRVINEKYADEIEGMYN